MKFTLANLRKLGNNYSFDEELDLSKELDGFEDIKSSSLCKVHTTIKERGEETYLCLFHIEIDLVLEDSVTLAEIPYNITVDAEELFSNDENLDDAFPIEGITLDTKEAVLTNILINKPMATSNSEFDSDDDGGDDSSGENINPAFAALKDLL